MRNKLRLCVLLSMLALLIYALMMTESGISTELKWTIISIVIGSGLVIYTALSWFIPYILNHSAEQLSPQKLVSLTVTSSGILAAITGFVATLSLDCFGNVDFRTTDYCSICGLFAIITAGITAVYSLKSFVQRWKALLLMEEGLKQAVLKAEFESLKNQVNPHFLFNSLNILSALIPEDTGKSVQFVERLSKVFRYSLQHSEQNTIELATELKIAESYLFINQMRFGESFRYTVDLSEADRNRQIVTQGLLTLLENVVKHNECSLEKPLVIQIYTEKDCLVVSNSYQPKSRLRTDSTGIGLKNLQNRYVQLAADRPVEIAQTEREFMVKLPLLEPAAHRTVGNS
ncbi:sensor histidine kinase [Larkinella insperata]|uniref:Sensor histidine kinase n=1 Tax=Larkinella insperata TaxID=332158 RepID=A0ABW3QBQ5_9BACT|nr:histidine kinase [Larkinella insperata]